MTAAKLIFATLALAAALAGPSQASTEYNYRHPVAGLRVAPVISMTLGAITLPTGRAGAAYSVDLKPFVTVSDDSGVDPTKLTLSVQGALPPGLTLSANGVLQGTPTTKNMAGTAFTVQALYKGRSATQATTLAVDSFTTLLQLHFNNSLADDAGKSPYSFSSAVAYSTNAAFGSHSLRPTQAAFTCVSPFNMLEAGTNNFTIEMWVKPETSGVWGALMAHHMYGSAMGFYLYMGGDGALVLHESPSSVQILASTSKLTYNSWQHFAMVRNAGVVTFYINGAAAGSTTNSAAGYYAGSGTYGNVSIGGGACNSTVNPTFPGLIDEVRVTSGARYTGAFTPPSAPFN